MRKKLLAGVMALALCSTNMSPQTIFAGEFTSGNLEEVSEETPEIFSDDNQEVIEETEEEVTEEEAEYGAVEQTFQTSDILGTTVVLDEEVSELAAKLGEEAEIDAEALSALVDDNAGPEMTAQFGKPFVSAPTEDGYETELLEETLEEPSELYNRDADPFEDEDDCEEYEEKEETDEIILDEEDEELDEEEGDAEGLD